MDIQVLQSPVTLQESESKHISWNVKASLNAHTLLNMFGFSICERFRNFGVTAVWLNRENLYPSQQGKESLLLFKRERLQNHSQEG